MRRRDFISFLGGAVVALPRIAGAQQAVKVPKIGVLWHAGSAEEEAIYLGALRQGFSSLGYHEGQNIVLENRFPAEQYERFFILASELVQLKVDVLAGSPALRRSSG